MIDHNSDQPFGDSGEPERPDDVQMTQPIVPPDSLPEVPSPDDEDTETSLQPLTPAQIEALQHTRRNPAPEPPSTVITEPIQRVQAPVPTPSSTTPPVSGGARRTASAAHTPPRAQAAYTPPPYQQPYAPPPRRRRKRPARRFPLFTRGCLLAGLAALAVFMGLVLIVGLIVVQAFSSRLEDSLARLEDLSNRPSFQTTTLFDRNGEELYQIFGEGRRTNVRLEDLPPYVGQATVAIEDDSFYQNPGIDLGSILRATLQNTREGEIVSGASTITQQLVRNIAFDYEYRTETSLQRKIEEAILAVILTTRMSKDDILELYLNEVYYGNLAYGIEAASQTILGKPAAELTLGEAALLAGLPQAPAELDPLNPDPDIQEAVLARRRLVIDRMLDRGYISQEEAYAAYGEPLSYVSPDVPLVAPHFTVAARAELESILSMLGYPPEALTTRGLQVYTTLDLRYQGLVERVASEQVAQLRDAHNLGNAAVVVLHPRTGEVLAMAGSVDYWDDSIDGRVNVALAPRQPGSTMKPFTYAAALEQGWSAATILWDTELRLESPGQPDYIPVNYDRALHGPVRMRDALANSYNIPAVRTLRAVTVEYLLNFMQRLGVQSLGDDASYYGLSLTLGGGEVTLLELSRAYSAFANGGLLVPTTLIACIMDGEDQIIYQYENGCPRGEVGATTVNAMAYGVEVLDPRVAFVISDILADNTARTPAMGANSPLNTGSVISSVKTGTTNDTRDNWTVGYTHNVVVGVWAGNADNTPMVNTSGLIGAAPIWHDVLLGIYNDPDLLAVLADNGQLTPDDLTPPSGLSRQRVCEISTLRDPATDCTATRVEWFLDGPALIPDGNGGLVPGPMWLQAELATPDPNANGPQLLESEAGLYLADVIALPADMAQAIVAANVGADPLPPAPRYCLVPNEVLSQVPNVRRQLFIGGPTEADDAILAAQWAEAANVPILPALACTAEMLGAAASGPNRVAAYISSPAPNQQVREQIPIMGTADLGPEEAIFYKIEISGGQFGSNWYTLGDVHSDSVFDGQLEILAAQSLQPGTYFLQLIIMGPDGNYLQSPYQVSFIVP